MPEIGLVFPFVFFIFLRFDFLFGRQNQGRVSGFFSQRQFIFQGGDIVGFLFENFIVFKLHSFFATGDDSGVKSEKQSAQRGNDNNID